MRLLHGLVLAASAALAFGSAAQAQDTGPIGHWALDDADGSKLAADTSGHANPAKCGPVVALGSGMSETVNCPTFGVPGKLGTAAYFPDIANFLVVNNTIAKSFTISAWIKTTEAGQGNAGGQAYDGTGVIWSDISGAAADMIPMALQAGHMLFGTGDCKSGAYDTLTSGTAVNSGKWVFVAVTRDAATGRKRIYVDGKLDGQHDNTGTCALDANKIIAFGGNPLDDRYFKGTLDDIRFYDRALTADEIAAVFKPPLPAVKAAQAAPAVAPATKTAQATPVSPAEQAAGAPFAGLWTADIKTVPPQQPPAKSQTLTVTRTPSGYTTAELIVEQEKQGTGTSTMNGKIVLGGKPFQGTMGETRTCNRTDANTIHCTATAGPHSFEEIYVLSNGGTTLSDTMQGKGPDGTVHAMTTVYRRTGAAPPEANPNAPQRLVTHNGECEVTLPPGWDVDRDVRQANAPDRAVDVHLFSTGYVENLKTLAQLKALNIGAYKPVKTFEDTPQRVWWQFAPHFENNNGWFVAVLGKTGTCNLEISFRNSVIPDPAAARKIALSLMAVK